MYVDKTVPLLTKVMKDDTDGTEQTIPPGDTWRELREPTNAAGVDSLTFHFKNPANLARWVLGILGVPAATINTTVPASMNTKEWPKK